MGATAQLDRVIWAGVIHLKGLGERNHCRQGSLLVGRLGPQSQVAQRASCVVLHPLLTCTHAVLLCITLTTCELCLHKQAQ